MCTRKQIKRTDKQGRTKKTNKQTNKVEENMKKREEMKEEEQGGEFRKRKREQVDRQPKMKGR